MRDLAFGELGMSYLDYARTTWGQFVRKVEGHQRREAKTWEHTRFLSYIQYLANTPEKERKEIYEFLPLSTDPSEKDRERVKQKEQKKEERKALRLIKHYQKQGFLS